MHRDGIEKNVRRPRSIIFFLYFNHCLHESFAPQMILFWVYFRSYLVEWCEYLKAKHILKNYKIRFLYVFSLSVYCLFVLFRLSFCCGSWSVLFFFSWLGSALKQTMLPKSKQHTEKKSLTCDCIFFLVPHVFSKGCKNNEVANLCFAYYKYVTFNLKYNLMWSYFKWL